MNRNEIKYRYLAQ